MTTHTLSAVFDDPQHLEKAVEQLGHVGVRVEQCRVVARAGDERSRPPAALDDATRSRREAIRGALAGAGLALALGLIAALTGFVNWRATLGVIALGTVAGALGAGLIASSPPRAVPLGARPQRLLLAVAVDDTPPGPQPRTVERTLERSGGRLVAQTS